MKLRVLTHLRPPSPQVGAGVPTFLGALSQDGAKSIHGGVHACKSASMSAFIDLHAWVLPFMPVSFMSTHVHAQCLFLRVEFTHAAGTKCR